MPLRPTSPAPAPSSTDPPAAPDACVPPATTTPIDALAVGEPRADGTTRDWDITSFDGTVIRTHWFPLDPSSHEPAPTILMGPGWGSAGDVEENTVGLLGALTIGSLRDAGYNVVTWDPRGFGESTGTVQIDSPDYEARDVQQLHRLGRNAAAGRARRGRRSAHRA